MLVDLTIVAILLSGGAALANAITQLFVRIGTEEGRASDAVFVVMIVNLIVLVPAILLLYYPDYGLTRRSWLAFVAAGILGTLLGRAFTYTSIDRIGASRTAPIVASNALVATVLGIVLLDESLTAAHAIGIVLIVCGVAAIAWETGHENPENLSRRELLIGLLIPFGAAVAYGWEPIYASYGFEEGTPAPVGLVVKTVSATLGFALYLRWQNTLPDPRTLFDGWWFVLAGIANTLFLLGYYVALSIAPVNVVVPIIITQTLFVVLLSALFMPQRLEAVTWKLAVASTVVVVGVVLVSVFA